MSIIGRILGRMRVTPVDELRPPPTDLELRGLIRSGAIERQHGCSSSFNSVELGRWVHTDEMWHGTLRDGRRVWFRSYQGRILRETLSVQDGEGGK